MTSTTFIDKQTIIQADWLNDVNSATYAGTAVYTPAGTGAVATTVQAKLRQVVSVLDFGADNTGTSSSVTAFNTVLALGGTVYVPSGTYKLDSQVKLNTNNTTLFLAANVTLNLSGVTAQQTPIFGDQIYITANNCAVIGSGPSSILQCVLGTQANALGISHKSKLLIKDLVIDGGKSLVTAISDDTFESGISLICDTGGGATLDLEATIDNVTIRNFMQYGINIYGNLCNGIKITNCNIYSMGDTGQALSVGSGVVSTKGVTDLQIVNNTIKNNKFHGIFVSSAGTNGGDHIVTANNIHQNGGSGIAYAEQASYGSVTNVGLAKIAVVSNICWGNTRSGIYFNTDTVGKLQQISITGNSCSNNTYGGIELSCTNTSPNIVSDVVVSGNQATSNGTIQISAGQYVTNVQGVTKLFTPIVYGSTSAGTATYTSHYGSYVQNNNIVSFELEIDWSAHTGTGNLVIGGLPIVAANSEPQSTNFVYANGLTITGQGVWGPQSNQTYGTLGAINNGSYSAVAMDTAATLRITGTYFV